MHAYTTGRSIAWLKDNTQSMGLAGLSRCSCIAQPFRVGYLTQLLLLILLFSPQLSLTFAQVTGMPRISPPPLVRITGAFAAFEDTQRTNLQVLIVNVKETKWRMRIRDIKTLTASTNSGWGLLRDLFPPRLRLTGPDDLLVRLQQADIAGIPLILEGRLYVGDHMLYVTALTVTEP